jgi:glycosyltransferase involved in cell wall biosynthesis
MSDPAAEKGIDVGMAAHESTVGMVWDTRLGQRVQRLWAMAIEPSFFFYASTMLANAIGYAYYFVVARLLTVAQYGELVTLTALVYVFAIITRAVQAKTAQAVTDLRNQAQLTPDEAGRTVLRHMALPMLGGTLALMAAGSLLSPLLASFLKLSSVWPAVLLAAYVATHFLLAGPRGLLLGSGRLYFLSWVTVLDPIVRVLAAVVLVVGPGWATGAMTAFVAGNLAAALAAVVPFLGRAPASAPTRSESPLQWLGADRQFLYALFVNAALMLLASVDPVAVRRMFSETVAGNFSVAFLLGRMILLSTNAASWAVFSRAVHLRPGDPRIRRVLGRGLLLAGGIAALMTAAYWVAPGLATRALGGGNFQSAGEFVGLVGAEMVVFAFVSVLAYYHLAIGNRRLTLPMVLAMGLELALLWLAHNTPYAVPSATTTTLTALLAWLALETARTLRLARHPAGAGAARPRACMIVHSHYPSDPRVRREAEALVEAGWEVDVICVPDGDEPREAIVGGVRVMRMPVQRNRMGSQLSYLAEYGRFFLAAAARVTALHLRHPYLVVQAHNMPDFLVFTAVIPRLLGARVVLDVHDLVPEFYALRYRLPLSHPLVRLTRWVQRRSVRFADHVLTAGEPFRRELARSGLRPERVTSIMNSPDPQLFGRGAHCQTEAATPSGNDSERFVVCYHGTLTESNDLTVVLRALDRLRNELPGLELHIYGRGRALPELRALANELRLNGGVKFQGFRPLDEIPALIAAAHLGVVPQRQSAFTALNYPTKAFEYVAQGVPALVAHSPALDELFGDIPGVLFQPGDVEGLADLIRAHYGDPALRRMVVAQQQAVCAAFAWPAEKQRYVAVINQLAHGPEAALEPASA